MHNKIVKIAIFLLHSKVLNDIIRHIFSLHRFVHRRGQGITFSRVWLKGALKE